MDEPRRIRVMVVDDSTITRAGVGLLLSSEPDIDVVATVSDARQALDCYPTLLPDLVITDLRMPEVDGVELTRLLAAHKPPAKVLLLTHYDGDENVFGAYRAGAAGYLSKEISGPDLVGAVRAVAAGNRVFPAGIAEQLARRAMSPSLSPREIEVLAKLSEGLTNPEIALAMSLSRRTVSMYVSHILGKLEARTRTEAVSVAIRRGLVPSR